MKKALIWIALAAVLPCIYSSAAAKGITGIEKTKHNLSSTSPGRIKTTAEQSVCQFCHTPHVGAMVQPLWNRNRKSIYTTYKSSTLKASVGQPTGSSRLCLACHDGTVAVSMPGRRKLSRSFAADLQRIPAGKTNLGLDLSDDHPVSFEYSATVAAQKGQLVFPTALKGEVKLDKSGQMQCTTCHDAHNNQFGKFLVVDNKFSGLCTTCHNIDFWLNSAHRSSGATWNGAGQDPWPHTEYNTVAANGCENCHRPHTAGSREWLLNYEVEEDNCFACHNGNVASKDIKKEFDKPYRHPVQTSRRIHTPDEDPVWAPRHVECEDCHNPHAANTSPAQTPLASGSLARTTGVSSSGTAITPLRFEYELCYRCHTDNPGGESPVVTRQLFEKNLRRKFASSNASYHPVESVGQNRDVPSLIRPLIDTSRITCVDCHNSDSAARGAETAPRGPHGSIWEPILERQLITSDFTTESSMAYAMCYKCHNRNSILASESFPEHRKHIVDEKAPCTACHDSHGVEDNTHLINFDISIVFANNRGAIRYEDRGRFAGSCSLKCHDENHDRRTYPDNVSGPGGLLRKRNKNRIKRSF